MVTVSSCALPGKAGRYLTLLSLAIPAVIVWTLWYAVNSDQDDVNPILTQLIPAGHCTCQTSTVFECSSCLEPHFSDVNTSATDDWTFEYGRDDRNAGLSDAQCAASFPGLFEDVERAERYWDENGNISISKLDDIELNNGMTRAMIYNGDLYIVATRSKGEDHRRKTVATLSAMHRALAAMPSRHLAPKLEFVFSVEDKASDVVGTGHPLWTFARKASETSLFLVPDFGFWAWDNMIGKMNNQIGSYDDVVEKARDVENGLSFLDKEAKLVWRGKLSFAPKLRRTLLDVSRGHEWNDVKQLNWNVRENYMTLEDHCKYQYIAHVEGRSYSASLKYRQACHSVIVAHKLQYIQHHHYLLSSQGPTQNYVEVERDFSDLPDKMAHLLANPAEAQRIADNSIKTFRERYLTPAAEACYWRKLWDAYARVSETSELYVHTREGKKKRGLRFETFVLLGSEEMYDFQMA